VVTIQYLLAVPLVCISQLFLFCTITEKTMRRSLFIRNFHETVTEQEIKSLSAEIQDVSLKTFLSHKKLANRGKELLLYTILRSEWCDGFR